MCVDGAEASLQVASWEESGRCQKHTEISKMLKAQEMTLFPWLLSTISWHHFRENIRPYRILSSKQAEITDKHSFKNKCFLAICPHLELHGLISNFQFLD